MHQLTAAVIRASKRLTAAAHDFDEAQRDVRAALEAWGAEFGDKQPAQESSPSPVPEQTPE